MGDGVENCKVRPAEKAPDQTVRIWNNMLERKTYHNGTPYKEFLELNYVFCIC